MEIERKYLISKLPTNLSEYSHLIIEQGYLCTEPVVRIRRQNDEYILTYKSKGMLEREEYNLPLTKESYEHLKTKTDGHIITKKRYRIPIDNNLLIELDIFDSPIPGMILAEVEFPSREVADAFVPPAWFKEEVTYNPYYHNSNLSRL